MDTYSLLIKFPSRNRPHKFFNTLIKYIEYLDSPENTHFIISIDDDDITMNNSEVKNVIEKRIFSKTEDLIPVISFTSKASKNEEKKHSEFIERMSEKGYTFKQIKLLTDWYLRVRKSS